MSAQASLSYVLARGDIIPITLYTWPQIRPLHIGPFVGEGGWAIPLQSALVSSGPLGTVEGTSVLAIFTAPEKLEEHQWRLR